MRLKALATNWLSDPRKILLPAVAVLVFIPCLNVLDDPDLWWHLRLGQWIIANHTIPFLELFSYTANGNPLVAHEWLTDVIFASILSFAGLVVVAVFAALASWFALILTIWRANWRGLSPVTLAIALALAAKTAQPVLGTRPQVFTFLFVALTLWAVDRHLLLQRPGLKWLIPMFLVWANMHAGVVSGVGILALVFVIEGIKYRLHVASAVSWACLRALGLVTAGCALITMINPDGPGIYWFAIHVPLTESLKPILEWQSPNFHDPGSYGFLFLIASMLAMLPLARAKVSARDAILAAVGIALALSAARNLAVAVAMAMPVWAIEFDEIIRRIAKRLPPSPKKRNVKFGVTVGSITLALLLLIDATFVLADWPTKKAIAQRYPSCKVMAALNSNPNDVHLVLPYFDAGYMIYKEWPHVRVYEYGESISLGSATFANFVSIEDGQVKSPSALEQLDSSGTNAVLVGTPSNLDTELASTSGIWTNVLSDNGTNLYFRGPVPWTAPTAC